MVLVIMFMQCILGSDKDVNKRQQFKRANISSSTVLYPLIIGSFTGADQYYENKC